MPEGAGPVTSQVEIPDQLVDPVEGQRNGGELYGGGCRGPGGCEGVECWHGSSRWAAGLCERVAPLSGGCGMLSALTNVFVPLLRLSVKRIENIEELLAVLAELLSDDCIASQQHFKAQA